MSLLASRIKALRISNGYTQEDLGRKIGVHKQTISQYERGVRRPDTDTLAYLSDIFNVSSDYLLGKENVTLRLVEPIPRTCIPVLGRVAAGIPLDAISRRLGHSDSAVTRDVYFHVTKKLQERDADEIKAVSILKSSRKVAKH